MLENKAGVWSPIVVLIAKPGKEGKIRIGREKTTIPVSRKGNFTFLYVFGVENDATTSGTPVIKEKTKVRDVGKIWRRGFENIDGYFTLINPNSELYLTATGATTLQIQGDMVC